MSDSFFQTLEPRQFLSATPTGMTPAQIRHAYGFDLVNFARRHRHISGDGRGQTIAIVTAYDAPTIKSDLNVFSQTFGLPTTDMNGQPILTKVIHRSQPPADSGWSLEASLDVEWAHAIAPQAHILLVEAASASTSDLLTAVDYARSQPGVVAVSMSWGGHETPFDSFHDDYLTTPYGHIGGSNLPGGVSFVSASGDNGQPASWPAVSTHVVAVGGTTLRLGRRNSWGGESAWSGSGGGISQFQGTYAPDVAYDADPATGFSVYDSYSGGWQTVGGTSAGCPQWAALIAIADQGRAMKGLGSLDGPNQTLNALYGLSRRAFRDITTGANSNYAAGPGYDLVTGRGSPVVWRVVAGLVAYRDPGATMFAQSAGVTRSLSVHKQESPFADLFSTTPIL